MHFTVNEAGSPHQGTRGAPEGAFLQSYSNTHEGRVCLTNKCFFLVGALLPDPRDNREYIV